MSVNTMMKNKIKQINYKKLNKLSKDIAQRNNKTSLYVKFDMIRNFIKYGIGYTDYLKGDYINLTKEQKSTYLTTKSYYKLLEYLNPRNYRCVMNDKIVFNKIFEKYLKREYIDLRNSTIEDFEKFLKGKKVFFAKPACDFGGHGIEKIEVESIKSIENEYKRLINNNTYLLEEAVVQCKEMDKLNPYAVNSIRVITLVKDGKSYLLGNALRINTDEAIAVGCEDAYGRLGEDGKFSSRVVDDIANVYTEHPIAKIPFDSVKIPYVKEAFEMCKEAALVVPEIRYVGWDVAITEKGPLIMEGNEYPSYGLIQYYLFNDEHTGHLKEISDILGSEMDNIKL